MNRIEEIKQRLEKAPTYDKGMFSTIEGMEFLWSAKSDIEFLLSEVERLNKIKDVILKNYDDDKRLLEKKLAKAIEGLNFYKETRDEKNFIAVHSNFKSKDFAERILEEIEEIK